MGMDGQTETRAVSVASRATEPGLFVAGLVWCGGRSVSRCHRLGVRCSSVFLLERREHHAHHDRR